jgi:hypothetical protein
MALDVSKRAAGVPRWVKAFAWVGVAVLVLVIVMVASGHGPWQHMGSIH